MCIACSSSSSSSSRRLSGATSVDAAAAACGRKLFVGQLPSDIDEQRLRLVFSQFGHIVQLKLSRHQHTGNCERPPPFNVYHQLMYRSTGIYRPRRRRKSLTSLRFDVSCSIPLFTVANGVVYVQNSDRSGFRVKVKVNFSCRIVLGR